MGGMPPGAALLRPRCCEYCGLASLPLAASFFRADFLAGEAFADTASLCTSCCVMRSSNVSAGELVGCVQEKSKEAACLDLKLERKLRTQALRCASREESACCDTKRANAEEGQGEGNRDRGDDTALPR